MDNITHTLTGLMLSRAGLNRLTPHATAIVLVAANAADADIVAGIGGAADYLHYHRGITHSLFLIPLVAIFPVLLVRAVSRKPLPWLRAYAASAIGAASHPLLDWTNMYGVRLLEPFSSRWFRADILAVIDVWIWALLILGVMGAWVSRLVSSEIGAKAPGGRGWAIFALTFFAAYGLGRYVLHERAVAVLDSRMYNGVNPIRVAALPTPVSPLRWVGLVEARDFYVVQPELDLLQEYDPTAGRVLYKPDAGAEIERAAATGAFRIFLAFSQFPLWRVLPVSEPEGGQRVEAMDLRFGGPEDPHFVATAILDGRLRVERSWFSFGRPSLVRRR